MSTTTNLTTVTPESMVALYDALHATIDRRGALCILYATEGTSNKARVIVPDRIEEGKYADRVWAWDSMRQEQLPFRLDRFVAYHLLPIKGVS